MEPIIKIKPPGPQAKAILERDSRVMSQCMAREYPLVLEKAEGLNLWDVDGNRYLDITAGIAVMNVGWNHPDVVRAVTEQAKYLSHSAFLDFCSEVPVKLAEKLTGFLPSNLNTVYYSNSGAESVEAAMKLARHHTKRKFFIAFYGGFHGRTMGALSLTAGKVIQRKHFGPLLPVIHVPYPNPYRMAGFDTKTCDFDVLDYIKNMVFKTEVSPEEVAAIFVEPIQGEGGYIVPPPNFLKGLREICDEHGIMLVADEVQSGCFRTGKFLASEHSGVKPDIVCLSKALGGGMPLGATIASDEIMNWPPGSHASTFGGNNISCAASHAVLEVMSEPGFGKHVQDMGDYLMRRLKPLMEKHDIIGDVRGIGLMAGIELVRDKETREPAKEERNSILNRAFEKGVTFLPAGESVIRFCPPLTIDEEHIDIALDILDESIGSI